MTPLQISSFTWMQQLFLTAWRVMQPPSRQHHHWLMQPWTGLCCWQTEITPGLLLLLLLLLLRLLPLLSQLPGFLPELQTGQLQRDESVRLPRSETPQTQRWRSCWTPSGTVPGAQQQLQDLVPCPQDLWLLVQMQPPRNGNVLAPTISTATRI